MKLLGAGIVVLLLTAAGFYYFDPAVFSSGSNKQHVFNSGSFQIEVSINPNPPRLGSNQFLIGVSDKSGQTVQAEVRAVAQQAATADTPLINRAAAITAISVSRYQATLDLPNNGVWVLAIDVHHPTLGHADLVLTMTVGQPGFKLFSATAQDVAYYTCSMHPSVKSATPGSCPICSMGLIAVKHRQQQLGEIILDEKKRQRIGVTTDKVKQQSLLKTIHAAGLISYDQSRLYAITLKYDAWIETLQVNDVGLPVKKGQSLFSVYSADLLSAQQEYLASLQGGGRYQKASAQRLQLWGVNSAQLRQLRQRGRSLQQLPVQAPVSGIVIEKNIIQGSAVKAGATLLRIAKLDKVWVEAAVYQNEIGWLAPGLAAEISIPELPGQHWSSHISRIDPVVDRQTHSARIRFELDNAQGLLRPGMYASVNIDVDLGERLLIPVAAVLISGEKRVVFKDLSHGKLQPVEIKTGLQNDHSIEIISGLKAGDQVVTSGHFLIAAESKLQAGLSQW